VGDLEKKAGELPQWVHELFFFFWGKEVEGV
jgi:hypothetical protein